MPLTVSATPETFAKLCCIAHNVFDVLDIFLQEGKFFKLCRLVREQVIVKVER